MTKQEKRLWYDFLRYYPVKIYRQRSIEQFIVDFYCSEAKIVIEIDGYQHFTAEGAHYDALRSEVLERHGLRVIRFTNDDIDRRFLTVCSVIDEIIQDRLRE